MITSKRVLGVTELDLRLSSEQVADLRCVLAELEAGMFIALSESQLKLVRQIRAALK